MIVRVYGRCDGFEVIFQKTEEGLWTAEVPPDLTDGKYAAEIFAEDIASKVVCWTGFLYLYDSRLVRLELAGRRQILWGSGPADTARDQYRPLPYLKNDREEVKP